MNAELTRTHDALNTTLAGSTYKKVECSAYVHEYSAKDDKGRKREMICGL